MLSMAFVSLLCSADILIIMFLCVSQATNRAGSQRGHVGDTNRHPRWLIVHAICRGHSPRDWWSSITTPCGEPPEATSEASHDRPRRRKLRLGANPCLGVFFALCTRIIEDMDAEGPTFLRWLVVHAICRGHREQPTRGPMRTDGQPARPSCQRWSSPWGRDGRWSKPTRWGSSSFPWLGVRERIFLHEAFVKTQPCHPKMHACARAGCWSCRPRTGCASMPAGVVATSCEAAFGSGFHAVGWRHPPMRSSR